MSPRMPRSPAGNDRTSVVVWTRRNRPLSARMRLSVVTATVTAPRARAGATRASHTASARPAAGARPTLSTRSADSPIPAGRHGIVGPNDLLHQLVAHHVRVVEVDEPDALHVLHDPERLDQAGCPGVGQVDLRDVPGHHGL